MQDKGYTEVLYDAMRLCGVIWGNSIKPLLVATIARNNSSPLKIWRRMDCRASTERANSQSNPCISYVTKLSAEEMLQKRLELSVKHSAPIASRQLTPLESCYDLQLIVICALSRTTCIARHTILHTPVALPTRYLPLAGHLGRHALCLKLM